MVVWPELTGRHASRIPRPRRPPPNPAMGHPTVLPRPALPSRRGTTLIEMMVVLVVLGVLIAVTMPKISRGVGQSRVDRASRIAMNDLRLASQLAARHRRPVRWIKGATNNRLGWRITNAAAPETVYVDRPMSGTGNDFSLSNVSTLNNRDTVL